MASRAGPFMKGSAAAAILRCTSWQKRARVAAALLKYVQKGDLVLTLGAGDIWTAGEDLLARLNGKAAGSGEARP